MKRILTYSFLVMAFAHCALAVAHILTGDMDGFSEAGLWSLVSFLMYESVERQ